MFLLGPISGLFRIISFCRCIRTCTSTVLCAVWMVDTWRRITTVTSTVVIFTRETKVRALEWEVLHCCSQHIWSPDAIVRLLMLQTNTRRRHVDPSLSSVALQANQVTTDLSTGLSPPQGSLSDAQMFRRAVVHLCQLVPLGM